MEMSETAVLVTGHAKPVKDDAISAVYSVLSISIIVEPKDDRIIDFACTTVMKNTEEFLCSLFIGKNIITDMDWMLKQIKTRFFSIAQKPVMVALQDANNRYKLAFPGKRPGGRI